MKEAKYKTNINCNGCIATVTPFLEKLNNIQHWEVDIKDKEKILTVRGEELDKKAIEKAVAEAGFSIEPKKKKWF
jgi:copper chaperone